MATELDRAIAALNDCPIVKTASGTLTTTGTANIWAPSASTKKFRVRFVAGAVMVSTVLAGSGVTLNLYDATVGAGNVILPLAAFAANAAAGTVLMTWGQSLKLPTPGIVSATANNTLILSANATLSTGVITYALVVAGDEV